MLSPLHNHIPPLTGAAADAATATVTAVFADIVGDWLDGRREAAAGRIAVLHNDFGATGVISVCWQAARVANHLDTPMRHPLRRGPVQDTVAQLREHAQHGTLETAIHTVLGPVLRTWTATQELTVALLDLLADAGPDRVRAVLGPQPG
ncbi:MULTISPECIES: hypothetical protein [unclassified Crossiella]|uniref:hypothetical protein n=1 Tax=unclassified Crossiella TaxID=2620835 RepID=UPI0020004BF4|nr:MULTISPECIES: hypothetical protein [unclassified Crossiella]MCK2245500.1 hypothetical protein [Crossiella sp. S99.2]MCK2259157.1 hypothetical protein [Crossiella sp. S99.1]